jgi:GGDEF domain-containing protein
MRDELEQVERRLSEAEITDPVTGLMNRREMERCIAEFSSGGTSPVLLLFVFSAKLPDEVARQAGDRLTAQFRHNDLIARWNDHQFVVLFQGTRETACARSGQIVPWIGGQYVLEGGGALEVAVDVRMVDVATLSETEMLVAG